MKELRLVLEEKLLIRREKKEVMSQLPSKVREMIILDPDLIQLNSKSLKQASKNMDNLNLKGMEKRGALLNYFQETAKAKVAAVGQYILDMLENGEKFIVFAHHQLMLDELQTVCESAKHDYIRIDGSTGSEKRQTLVDKFQNQEKCKCALLSITAASTGITLTQSSLVIFGELYWNPGILIQAEDRAYRIGQKNSVTVQYLCARGTADDQIWPLVNDKLNVLSKAGLTKEDLREAGTLDKAAPNIKKVFEDLIEIDENVEMSNSDEAKPKSLVSPSKTKHADTKNQPKIDELLRGVDLSEFMDNSPPNKKYKA